MNRVVIVSDVILWLLSLSVVVKSFESKEDASIIMNNNVRSRERRSVSSAPRQNCGTWSPWVNDHHPSNTDVDDKEFKPKSELDTFCPPDYGGNLTRIMCKDERGEPFFGNITDTKSGHAITCENPYIGAICKKLNSGLVSHCPDLSMQYYCACSNKTFHSTTRTTTGSTTTQLILGNATVTPNTESLTTQAPTTNSKNNNIVETKDHGPIRKDVISITDGLVIPWWIIILIVTVILFIISLCVTICLYQRLKRKILERAQHTKVHPLRSV